MNNTHSQPRAHALQLGQLIDVTELARHAGFKPSTAFTRAAWKKYVSMQPGTPRVHKELAVLEILSVLHQAVISLPKDVNVITFKYRIDGKHGYAKHVHIKAICETGDQGESVIRVMLPEEA